MKNSNYFFAIIIIVTAISCSVENIKEDISGSLTIKLTDAPMPYDQFMEAAITIDRIEIGNSTTANSFIVITDAPMTYNMLELVNGITTTMANADIPEGNYDMIRLYISATKMVMNNGNSYFRNVDDDDFMQGNGHMQNSMTINNNTGSLDIRLDHFLDITNGSHDEFLLDIDVDRSFMLEGVDFVDTGNGMMMNMTGFRFNPTMRFVDMAFSGSVSGTIHMDNQGLPNATISLMQGSNVYTSTHTDGNGHYTFIGIPSGMYTINVIVEGYEMNSNENQENMEEFEMMSGLFLNMDFSMISSN